MTKLEELMREWLASGEPAKVRHATERIALGFDKPLAVPPSTVQLFKNITGSAFAFVASGCELADEATVANRLTICGACPNYNANTCRLCGCHMPFKVKAEAMACPDNPPRW